MVMIDTDSRVGREEGQLATPVSANPAIQPRVTAVPVPLTS
jgi:hypothetical protein